MKSRAYLSFPICDQHPSTQSRSHLPLEGLVVPSVVDSSVSSEAKPKVGGGLKVTSDKIGGPGRAKEIYRLYRKGIRRVPREYL